MHYVNLFICWHIWAHSTIINYVFFSLLSPLEHIISKIQYYIISINNINFITIIFNAISLLCSCIELSLIKYLLLLSTTKKKKTKRRIYWTRNVAFLCLWFNYIYSFISLPFLLLVEVVRLLVSYDLVRSVHVL